MPGMIEPEYLARSDTEEAHQIALMQWAWLNRERYPMLEWLHHIPNGGQRNKIAAAKMKLAGVRRGIPDLFLPWPIAQWHGLYIEMKKPAVRPKRPHKPGTKPGGASEEQWEFGQYALTAGYAWMVCYSWTEARDAIIQYLEWKQ